MKNNLRYDIILCRFLHKQVRAIECSIEKRTGNQFNSIKNNFESISIFTIEDINITYILFQSCGDIQYLRRILNSRSPDNEIYIMSIGKQYQAIKNLEMDYENLSVSRDIYHLNSDKKLCKNT